MSKITKNKLTDKIVLSNDTSAFSSEKRVRPFWLSILFTSLKLLTVFLILFLALGTGLVMGVAKAYIDTTPTLDLAALTDSSKTSYIYDRNGELITTFADLEYREWAEIDEVPDMLKNAVVAIEDVRFYKHDGLDYKRLLSAIINTFRNQDTHGGSTITQQLIKNTILTNVQSYKRKIQEAYLALELEATTDKDAILEAYLNDVFLGDQNYGVKSAAKDYFGKELSDLTIRECAMLAGMIQKPSAYNPRLNTYSRIDEETGENYMWRTNERTDVVINAMYDAGFITREQRDAALNDTVTILKDSQKSAMYDMPYFVEYAVYDIMTYMLKQQGLPDTKANRDMVEMELKTGGYNIYLTVDPEIQAILEYEVENYNNYPPIANSAGNVTVVENADGTTTEVVQPQAAAVIYDHNSGEIVALVGGRTPPTQKKGWHRAYMSEFEVGSSIKPIAVYAPAIDMGVVSPATPIPNIPGAITGWNTDTGHPALNGDMDVVTVRRGIRSSLNIVAARVLMEHLGLENSRDYMVNLGIPQAQLNVDGSGLALGTSGITQIQMAAAYGTIANGGVYQTPMSFSRVEDANGQIIIQASDYRETRRVFREETAYLIIDMLEDAVNSGTGTAARISGMTVAGKTGTNSDYSSVCFSGMTPYYTATVWIGHDYSHEYRLGNRATGGVYAAPLWQNFMERIHEDLDNADILDYGTEALDLATRTICSVSGLLATDACNADATHPPVSDYFISGTQPTESCNMHILLNACPISLEPASVYCPSATSQSFILIGSTSSYAVFERIYLDQVFPNALYTEQTIDTFTGDGCLCTLHSGGWNDLNSLIQSAQSLISRVEAYIQGENNLTNEQIVNLQQAIQSLQTAIDMQSSQHIQLMMNNLTTMFYQYTGTAP